MHFFASNSWSSLTLSPPAFLKKVDSHHQRFCWFSLKFHGPAVWISEHAMHQNKDQTLYLQTKKNPIYSSFKHCFFYQHLNIGMFHLKKATFWAKSWENRIYQLLHLDHIQYYQSKDAVGGFHQYSQSLHRPLQLSGLTYHSVTFSSFHLYDHIIFHMHMLEYEIAHFCVFLVCVFDLHFLDSFRRCVIAPPSV